MENDFIKLNRKLKLENIFNTIKEEDARKIPEIAILVNEIGLVQLFKSNPAFIASGISLITLSSYLLYLGFKFEKTIYHNRCYNDIQKLLRSTETYKKCSDSYHDYIIKFNDFFKENNISTPIEIITAYQKMLIDGYLFESGRGGYNLDAVPRNKFDNVFELKELLGCRVATGGYVCRHISSLLTDIFNSNKELKEKNIQAFFTKAWIINEEEKKINYNKEYEPNHAIVLLKDNDKYFGYCPTANVFILIDEYIEKNNSIKIKAYDFFDKNIKYTGLISKKYNNFPDLDKDKYNMLFSSNIMDNIIDEKSLKELYVLYLISIKKIISLNEDKFTEFHNSTSVELKSMQENINEMVPITTNKKIKQLIIK